MGGQEFTIVLSLAAGLLALWLDIRIGEERRPGSPTRRMAHVCAGIVALQLAVFALSLADGAALMAVLLTVFLPAFVYALLAALWALRCLAELSRLPGR
jgi:heme A synthase